MKNAIVKGRKREANTIEHNRLTWDQALFSFRFENYIPEVAVRENVWEPLKLNEEQVDLNQINI